jgi:hypothetical protein
MGLKGTHKSDGIHKKMVGGTPGELLEIWWKSKENGRGYPREAVGDLMGLKGTHKSDGIQREMVGGILGNLLDI